MKKKWKKILIFYGGHPGPALAIFRPFHGGPDGLHGGQSGGPALKLNHVTGTPINVLRGGLKIGNPAAIE